MSHSDGGVGNGGGYERVKFGGQEEISVPSSPICCESTCKTALKKQALKKKSSGPESVWAECSWGPSMLVQN